MVPEPEHTRPQVGFVSLSQWSMLQKHVCQTLKSVVVQLLRDKSTKWPPPRLGRVLIKRREEAAAPAAALLSFLVKNSPAATAVRYQEVEKRGILKRSVSSLQLLRCLELRGCSVFPDSGLDVPRHRFFLGLQIFPQLQAKKIYLQFVFLIADLFQGESRRVQEADPGMWNTKALVVWNPGIDFTHGHWRRAWHGLWTSVGVFLSEGITSKYLAGEDGELSAEGERGRSLLRRWQ